MKLSDRFFFEVCRVHATKVALRHVVPGVPTIELTFAQLCDRVMALSKELAPLKPAKSAVPILGPPTDTVVGILAAWNSSAIAVPMCLQHTAAEHSYVFEDTTARCMISGTRVKRLVLATDCVPVQGEDDDALIIYTSGTTGKPKGVVHTNASVQSQIDILRSAWRWSHRDVVLNHLPLHHVHGLINVTMCALYSGATVEFSEFEKERALRRLSGPDADSGGLTVNVFMSVPTAYVKLCEAYDALPDDEARAAWTQRTSSQLRLVVSGSAAMPTPILHRVERMMGCRVLERYGMTEAGMILSQSYDNPNSRVAGTVGRPLPGVTGNVSAEGELCIRSPSLFRTYWNRPDVVTRKEFTPDGFFRTGDTVGVDGATGDYTILGRTSVDIVKVSGYKISTLEVESVILEIAGVVECCVFGRADDTYGQVMVAIVVCTRHGAVSRESVQHHCESKLARYKIPREIFVVDTPLPRNAMGKVSKKQIAGMPEWK